MRIGFVAHERKITTVPWYRYRYVRVMGPQELEFHMNDFAEQGWETITFDSVNDMSGRPTGEFWILLRTTIGTVQVYAEGE